MSAPLAGAALRWRTTGGELLVRDWADEVAVFHRENCTTHVLSADAAALLMTLRTRGGKMSAPDLWRDTFGGEAGDNDLAMLNEALQQLAQAGLVTAPTT